MDKILLRFCHDDRELAVVLVISAGSHRRETWRCIIVSPREIWDMFMFRGTVWPVGVKLNQVYSKLVTAGFFFLSPVNG